MLGEVVLTEAMAALGAAAKGFFTAFVAAARCGDKAAAPSLILVVIWHVFLTIDNKDT
ncbi:MAG TPA: hypothetical protein VFN02_13865 [Ktedonobacteraceae bacterium]|nr:hypothetical protein [Ktedonobacteraceae bacterium]